MPLLRNWKVAARENASVMTTAAGIPRFSNSTVSCTLHNVHEPHPPRAATAISTSPASSLMISGAATLENISFLRITARAAP